MIVMKKEVKNLIDKIDRNKVKNNTQKALLALLSPRAIDGWVARTAVPVKSAPSRIRELRRPEFGGFQVECVTASKLKELNPKRRIKSAVTNKQTFYRLTGDVTVSALKKVFKGVI